MLVRQSSDPVELARALALRERVFCHEQGVSFEAERDGRDDEAVHIVAIEDERLVGTCRLLFAADVVELGRMAVERRARGRGVASAMLVEVERLARERGAARVVLHAQVTAERLYARAGYTAYGQRFLEQGIEHIAMETDIA